MPGAQLARERAALGIAHPAQQRGDKDESVVGELRASDPLGGGEAENGNEPQQRGHPESGPRPLAAAQHSHHGSRRRQQACDHRGMRHRDQRQCPGAEQWKSNDHANGRQRQARPRRRGGNR